MGDPQLPVIALITMTNQSVAISQLTVRPLSVLDGVAGLCKLRPLLSVIAVRVKGG
jgi:hypothetical protein